MIKLIANVSKKVPIPGVDFSSQCYMAGIEVEVSDRATPEQIKQRIGEVYALLENSIDSELAAHGVEELPLSSPAARQSLGKAPGNNGGNGRNRNNGSHATGAQIKAIFAIVKSINMGRTELLAHIDEAFNKNNPDDLTVKQASGLIEQLQALQQSC